MAYHLPNLVWLRAFEAAARLGSFTAAAGELGLTQAAVSHQVRSLEAALGFRLFRRKARSLELTDMGRAYLPPVRKAMEELSLSTQGLFGPRRRRSVTVRAPISTAVLWLAPRLPHLRARHPNIRVRLISAIWGDTAAAEDVDVEVRLGTGDWPGLAAEFLSEDRMIAVCAPDVAARFRSLASLSEDRMIDLIGYQDSWARLLRKSGVGYDPAKVGMAVDTTLAAIELAAAGAGVALVYERYAEAVIRAGRVVVPFPEQVEVGEAHYLVSDPGAVVAGPEVEIVRQWLREAFAGG